MAVSAPTIHEVAATGSDGNSGSDSNAGAFDPATNVANMLSDLTTDANTANTSSPVVSSASYNFVAGDVNNWLFISSGTNWTPGWYKIASVASNKATLSAAIGAAILYSTGGPYSLNTAAGCATVGTPTSGVGAVDYSQAGTAVVSNTDLASSNGTNSTPTVTSASRTFTKNDVGNYIKINGGTNWTTGIFRITNVSGGGAILDRACGSAASLSGGTFREGGCLASPGQAGANHVGGNTIFLKNGTYTLTSASTNVAGGCVSLTANTVTANQTALIGYDALRVDAPKTTSRPTMIADGVITSFMMVVFGRATSARYLIVDGNSRTSARGMNGTNGRAFYCSAKRCTNGGFVSSIYCYFCDATTCSTTAAFNSVFCDFCVAWSNTVSGFVSSTTNFCLSISNSGASSDGFELTSSSSKALNCTAYGNGRDGFRVTSTVDIESSARNCISYGNTGTGFNASAAIDYPIMHYCAAGNNAANFSTNLTNRNLIGNITLTADPFTNAAGSDFSLNNTAGGGALLRALGAIGAFPGGVSTNTYADVGAAQHQDSGGGGPSFALAGRVPSFRGVAA